jgi:antitoxin component YwqK of YwqJK toxin-antitoxin module
MPKNLEIRTIKADSGERIAECEFVDGVPHGRMRTWSEDGVLLIEALFVRGEYHGRFQSWWSNGLRKEQGEYRCGKRVGVYRWFREDGTLLQESDCGEVL